MISRFFLFFNMKSFPRIKGCNLFLTGGYVRDTLLDNPIKDRDFAVQTNISWELFLQRINEIGKIYQTNEECFTVRCNIKGENIDLAFLRKEEKYLDGRHPSLVMRTNSLESDGSRRDFTINSMYMNNKGEILDNFKGKTDIDAKLIRCVGDADKRFREDYLRILRAIRFSIQLEFKIENKTFYAMKRNVKGLGIISVDRVKDELNKCLKMDTKKTIEQVLKIEGMTKILDSMGIYFTAINKRRR